MSWSGRRKAHAIPKIAVTRCYGQEGQLTRRNGVKTIVNQEMEGQEKDFDSEITALISIYPLHIILAL
jgi:hypothetical protein